MRTAKLDEFDKKKIEVAEEYVDYGVFSKNVNPELVLL